MTNILGIIVTWRLGFVKPCVSELHADTGFLLHSYDFDVGVLYRA